VKRQHETSIANMQGAVARRAGGGHTRHRSGSAAPTACHAVEGNVLRALLQRHAWNVAAVAREARIARSHLYTLIQRYGLTRPDE
jgi:DNA-binding NtrC family response regulator